MIFGIGVRMPPESLSESNRNRCPNSVGFSKREIAESVAAEFFKPGPEQTLGIRYHAYMEPSGMALFNDYPGSIPS